jgi:hypothetical protein
MAKKSTKSNKARALMAQAMKLQWSDPAWKKRTRKAMREADRDDERTPEWNAKISKARKKDWNNPVVRAKRVASMKIAQTLRRRRERAAAG